MVNFTSRFLKYSDFRRYGDLFIETGSAAGDGIQRALDAGFREVHSIEAAHLWYQMCVDRFNHDPRVHMHLGKSTEVLPKLELPPQTVFFLDAHPSGPLSAGHDAVMADPNSEAAQHNVIVGELMTIISKFLWPVIIIDDQDGLNSDSQYYIDLLKAFDPRYKFEFYDENLSGWPEHFYQNKLLVARYA